MQPIQSWGNAFFATKVTLDEKTLRVDRVGTHDSLLRSSILGVEQRWMYPPFVVTLLIRHPGGLLRIPWLATGTARAIRDALGF